MAKIKKGQKGHADRENSADVGSSQLGSTVELKNASAQKAECQPSPEQTDDEFDKAIRELAHRKWEAAGFPAGDGFDFWLDAEVEIKANQRASNPASE